MYHTKVLRRIRERQVLHGVMLELTFRCNLDCFFCYNDKDAQGGAASTRCVFEEYLVTFCED